MPSVTKNLTRKKIVYRAVWLCICIGLFLAAFKIVGNLLTPSAVREIARVTNTAIETESVSLGLTGSVLIEQLQVRPKEKQPYDNTILRAKKLKARFGLWSIIRLKPKLKKISIEDFIFDIQENLDSGIWNTDSFRPMFGKTGSGGGLPSIRLKNGRINFSRVKNNEVKIMASMPVDLKLEPSYIASKGYSFELVTSKTITNNPSVLKGSFRPGLVVMSGDFTSEDLPIFVNSFKCKIVMCKYDYDHQRNYKLDLVVEDMAYRQRLPQAVKTPESPPLIQKTRAFNSLHSIFDEYEPSGKVNLKVAAQGNFNEPNSSTVTGQILCRGVRIKHSKFPYAMENIHGPVEFTEKVLKIGPLDGRHGSVELQLSGQFDNLGPNTDGIFEIKSSKMLLDKDLYEALSKNQKRLWDDFVPTGIVSFNYKLQRYADKSTKFGLDVELLDVNSTCKYFPYPLDDVTGNMFFDRSSVTVMNLRSIKGDRIVTANGKLTETNTPQPKYDITVNVENVPLDQTLANALPDKEEKIYHQFNPSGFGTGTVQVTSKKDGSKKADFTADLHFKDTNLQPKMFLHPITQITAQGRFRPDSITFSQFDGRYGKVPVSLKGQIKPSETGDNVNYDLTITGDNAILGDEMFELVPPDMKKIVNEFAPSGKINYSAHITKEAEKKDYSIGFDCLGITVKPAALPTAIENLTGRILITPSYVTLSNLNGIIDSNAAIKLDGSMVIDETIAKQEKIKLQAERFVVENVALQQIQGDIRYNKTENRWLCDNLSAKLYGGTLNGAFALGSKDDSNLFEVQAGFTNVDLQRFLADRTDSNSSSLSSGTMNGSLNLAGSKGKPDSYFGTCQVSINNMQIGKLSPLAKMLTVLKIQEPADYAFDNMSFDSYIKGKMMHFEKFELSGKTLTFSGKGSMELTNKNIELLLAVKGPRLATLDPEIIGSLTDMISSAVLQMNVSGPLQNPQVTVKPFPVIQGVFELFGTKKQ